MGKKAGRGGRNTNKHDRIANRLLSHRIMHTERGEKGEGEQRQEDDITSRIKKGFDRAPDPRNKE